MEIHDANPLCSNPPPATPINIHEAHGIMSLGCKPDAAWEWIQTTPVWPRLTAGLSLAGAELECVGHANGWSFGAEPLAVGLPVVLRFDTPDTWDPRRQSWTIRRVTVAVNEVGTRGAVLSSELLGGPDNAREMAMEAFAFRAGGGVPDVD